MNILRLLVVAVLPVALIPSMALAQTSDASPKLARFSIQAAAGPLLKSRGTTASASVGFSPFSRLDFLVSIERHALPFQRDTFSDRYSTTRGGTLTTIGVEARASLLPPHRPSPFVFAGFGAGRSSPTVNDQFPEPIENPVRTVYAGAGLRIPLRKGLSLYGDARAMLGLEGDDGILGIWPVRAGLVWRF